MLLLFQYPMTILYDPTRRKDSSSAFNVERDACLKYFEKWNEIDQVEFVENLLARMCHYQHGHINSYLKPMLQRDFISLLPSECYLQVFKNQKCDIYAVFFVCRKRIRPCSRKCFVVFGRRKLMFCRTGVQGMVASDIGRNAMEETY